MSTIKTNRLILRQWTEEDLEPFANLNADPRVMEYFPSILTREESDASAKSALSHIEHRLFSRKAKSEAPFLILRNLSFARFSMQSCSPTSVQGVCRQNG